MEAFCSSCSLSLFQPLLQPRSSGVLTPTVSVSVSGYRRRPGHASLLSRSSSRNPSIFSFSASRKDSESSEIDIQEELEVSHIKEGAEESKKAWNQNLGSLKEEAMKMLNVSQEAYQVYLKRATIELRETSDKLKIQADKVSGDLSVIAKEVSEEGRGYLSAAAENSSAPVKDFVKTFVSSSGDLKDVLQVLDFYVAITYGGLLILTGFLTFITTRSIYATGFSVILGGTLLGLGIYSLRSWKNGKPASIALKGQTVIASILFLKDAQLVSLMPSFTEYIALIISGAVLAFYVYRIAYSHRQSKGGLIF